MEMKYNARIWPVELPPKYTITLYDVDDQSRSHSSCTTRETAATTKIPGYWDVKLTVTPIVAAASSARGHTYLAYANSRPASSSSPRPPRIPPFAKLKVATAKVTATEKT